MLIDILKRIDKYGYLSRSHLARELNSSEMLIDDGIQRLVQMGYLLQHVTSLDCMDSCGACPMAKGCHKEIVKTYEITHKGKALIA